MFAVSRILMKILVVNLTRFGDLLQSQPIISGLADQGYEVGLACLEHFAPAAVLLSDLACVAPFPASALLREVEEDWSGSLSRLFLWRQEIYKVFKPDVVVNLTPSLSARMLTRYLSLGSINFSDNFGQGQSVAQVQGEGHLGALNGNAAPKNLKAENFIGFGVDEFGFWSKLQLVVNFFTIFQPYEGQLTFIIWWICLEKFVIWGKLPRATICRQG
jgi:hypothetical protein